MSARRRRPEWVSGHRGEVLRIRIRQIELSCLPSELVALAQWIANGGGGPMPVAEFTKHPWTHAYRWTAAAWRTVVARRGGRA